MVGIFWSKYESDVSVLNVYLYAEIKMIGELFQIIHEASFLLPQCLFTPTLIQGKCYSHYVDSRYQKVANSCAQKRRLFPWLFP